MRVLSNGAGAIVLAALAIAANAAALSGPNRSALERAISRAMEAGETSTVSWNGYEGVSGTITPQRAKVAPNGERCAEVRYRIVTPQPAAPVRQWRCRRLVLGGVAEWKIQEETTPLPAPVRPKPTPLPDPVDSADRLTAHIQSALAELLYYNGRIDGHFNTATQKAYLAFLQDERKKREPGSDAEALQWLNDAIKRRRFGHCPASVASRRVVVACGVLTD